MATEREEARRGIDHGAYNAAVTPGTKIDDPQLIAALDSVTPGGKNSLLHLAASVGNLQLVQHLLKLSPPLVKVTNSQGNTPLHLAAQAGFSDVVEALLGPNENVINVLNKRNETALFKAYESGNLDTVKALSIAYPQGLSQRTANGRTCLYVAVIKGNEDLVKRILGVPDVARELIQVKYTNGDTALHVATGRSYVHIMSLLIEFQPELCYWVNDNQETPICMAAKLGHLEAVKMLIKWRPDAVEIRNSCGMNVLHLAAQVSQVRIVHYLNKSACLSDIVNHVVESPHINNQSEGLENGDTPLHIAARKKNFRMVESLLRIKGINKDAVNEEGLTALDIARENTEHYESHKLIAMLANYPPRRRHFLYTSPKLSSQKYENAINLVNKAYEDRRHTELVVAVLLATMSFTAAFTVPGGFQTEVNKGETQEMLGSPLLIGIDSFRAFLIFDCLAFFLSLLVVLMWHLSTPLTTGDKSLFLVITNVIICFSFGLTELAFISAVYSMLVHKLNMLAWLLIGFSIIICGCGVFLFISWSVKFTVKMARFDHLHGMIPLVHDGVVAFLWMRLEGLGCFEYLRWCKNKCDTILYSNCYMKSRAKPECGSSERGSAENV